MRFDIVRVEPAIIDVGNVALLRPGSATNYVEFLGSHRRNQPYCNIRSSEWIGPRGRLGLAIAKLTIDEEGLDRLVRGNRILVLADGTIAFAPWAMTLCDV